MSFIDKVKEFFHWGVPAGRGERPAIDAVNPEVEFKMFNRLSEPPIIPPEQILTRPEFAPLLRVARDKRKIDVVVPPATKAVTAPKKKVVKKVAKKK